MIHRAILIFIELNTDEFFISFKNLDLIHLAIEVPIVFNFDHFSFSRHVLPLVHFAVKIGIHFIDLSKALSGPKQSCN